MPAIAKPIELQTIVVTPKDAEYWIEACEAYKEDAQQAALEYSGIDEVSACSWAIYGLPAQGWLNLESNIINLEGVINQLIGIINYYRGVLSDDRTDKKE